MRRFAVSDIHGCFKTFRHLIENIIALQKKDYLFLLGDYIDRGPDSKGVLDYILQLKEAGYNLVALRGNHEVLALESLNNPTKYDSWIINGGQKTLNSFGVSDIHEIPELYFRVFGSLPYYTLLPDYWLVHAGFNFKADNIFEDYHAMLWIRNWYSNINLEMLQGQIIVHGHTPIKPKEILENLDLRAYPAINIDAGCTFGRSLCALDLDKQTVVFQENIDMTS